MFISAGFYFLFGHDRDNADVFEAVGVGVLEAEDEAVDLHFCLLLAVVEEFDVGVFFGRVEDFDGLAEVLVEDFDGVGQAVDFWAVFGGRRGRGGRGFGLGEGQVGEEEVEEEV